MVGVMKLFALLLAWVVDCVGGDDSHHLHVMGINESSEGGSEETKFCVCPEVSKGGRHGGDEGEIRPLHGDVSGSRSVVEEDGNNVSVHQRASPHVGSGCWRADEATLDPASVLVDGNDFAVTEDRESVFIHTRYITSDDQRRLHQAPQAKVAPILSRRHAAVPHLEHIWIVPSTWTRTTCSFVVPVEVVEHGGPGVSDVLGGSPRVTNCSPPRGDLFSAPFAEREEQGMPCGIESIAHGGVALKRPQMLVITVIVLQVVYTPACPRLCIDSLIS
jgi:hypothetical protein